MAEHAHHSSLDVGISLKSAVCPSENIATKNEEDELLSAEAELKKEKSNWLRLKVLYTAVHNVLQNARLGESPSLESHQAKLIFEKLIQAEAEHCCQKSRTFSRKSTTPTHEVDSGRLLCSLVEKDLVKTCEELLEYHDSLNSTKFGSSKVIAARTLKLGVIIKEEQNKLNTSRQELSDIRKTEKELFTSCVKEILQSSEALCKIIIKYKLKLQPKMDDEKFSNVVSRCEALGLKAGSMTSKLQRQLYTGDGVVALRAVRSELSERKRNNQQEIVAIEQQLHDFKKLGDEFNAIVNEYNQLQTDIEKRTWALNKLQQ